MGLCHDTDGPEFADIGVESRHDSVRLYIPAVKIGDFHKADPDKIDIDTHACVEIDNDLIEPLMRCLALAQRHARADAGQAAPSFERLDWGGIQTDDRGREALADASAVLEWLAADYAALRETYKAAAHDPAITPENHRAMMQTINRDLLVIWRMQSMVLAARGNEREQRETVLREANSDVETVAALAE